MEGNWESEDLFAFYFLSCTSHPPLTTYHFNFTYTPFGIFFIAQSPRKWDFLMDLTQS